MEKTLPEFENLQDAKRLLSQGRLEEASAICHRLINKNSDDEAVYLLAVITGQSGRYTESITLFEKAVKSLPGRCDVTYNYGVILNGMGKPDDAIQWWEKTLDRQPDHADCLFNLGRAYADKRQWNDALKIFERLLVLEPGNPRVLLNMGNMHFRLHQWDRARSCFGEVLVADAAHDEALTNLGLTESRDGNPEAAIEQFNRALEKAPENLLAHVNLAQALLLCGTMKKGYAENEWRRKIQELRFSVSGQSPWEGEDATGKRVLLYAEQGQGDAIQFLRYASKVAQLGGLVSIYCHPSLTAIAEAVQGVETAAGFDEPAPGFDVYAPLMSLPHLLGMTELKDIPSAPYLIAPSPAELSGNDDFLRVGLVWAGNRAHDDEARRYMPLAVITPLLEVANLEFLSLQTDNAGGEIKTTKFSGNITDLGTDFSDFVDTAAALQALDLIISVDTATAHLAGALGKPVWLMLPRVPDWRWFREGEDTPWYPSMRLFRQTGAGTWEPVILEIKKALKTLNKDHGKLK